MVTMTVFINDVRLGDKFVEMRAGFFPGGNFPASALITVSNFARPGMLIEIQGVAVVGGYVQTSTFSAAMNASCGMSTLPYWRIFFLPFFCLSRSLRLRVTSPP